MTVHQETGMPSAGNSGPEPSKPARVADQASTEASNVASAGAEGAREVAGEATTQAKAVAGQAKQQLDGLVSQARDEMRQQAQQRNDQAAGRLRTLSEQLTALADGRTESAGPLVGYLQDAESQVRRFASRLEQGGPQGVMDDVTNFARRRPGMFLIGAVGVGFLAGRALRAGIASQQESGDSSAAMPTPTAYQTPMATVVTTEESVTALPGDGPTRAETAPFAEPVLTEPLPPPVTPDPGIRP